MRAGGGGGSVRRKLAGRVIADLQLRSRRISTRDQLSLKPPGHLLIRSVDKKPQHGHLSGLLRRDQKGCAEGPMRAEMGTALGVQA
eukprot:2994960-Prymnesium_polylepis.1